MENNSNKNHPSGNDFKTNSFLEKKIPQHDREIGNMKRRLDVLEDLVGSKENIALTIANIQKDSKVFEEAVRKSIDAYDNHKIKTSVIAILKWGSGVIVGGILAWLAVQALLIPQYSLRIEALQQEINELRNSP